MGGISRLTSRRADEKGEEVEAALPAIREETGALWAALIWRRETWRVGARVRCLAVA